MCRRNNPIGAISCVCGHGFKTQFAPANIAPPPVRQDQAQPQFIVSHSCPVCGSPDIQKVSAILGTGVWSTNSRGVSVGGGHVVGGPNFITSSVNFSKSASATHLAQSLAPPPAPIRRSSSFAGTAIFGTMALCSLCGFGAAFENKSLGGGVAVTVIFLSLVALAVWMYLTDARYNAKQGAIHAFEAQRWQQAMANWETFYYCGKCDSVHKAGTNQAAPSHAANTLL